MHRLVLLAGSKLAGDNRNESECTQVSHLLNKLGVLDNNQLSDLLKEYVT